MRLIPLQTPPAGVCDWLDRLGYVCFEPHELDGLREWFGPDSMSTVRTVYQPDEAPGYFAVDVETFNELHGFNPAYRRSSLDGWLESWADKLRDDGLPTFRTPWPSFAEVWEAAQSDKVQSLVINLAGNAEAKCTYVARGNNRAKRAPSLFANPIKVEKEEQRMLALELFFQTLPLQPPLLTQLHTLAGLRLGCWCAPLPCHAMILAALAAYWLE